MMGGLFCRQSNLVEGGGMVGYGVVILGKMRTGLSLNEISKRLITGTLGGVEAFIEFTMGSSVRAYPPLIPA